MPYALFRKSPQQEEFAKLAEEHMKHDLEPSDREALVKAANSISMPAALGTLVGLGLGVYAALRLQRVRAQMIQTLRVVKPAQEVFVEGIRVNGTPDPRLSRFGDIATYFFFGLGGTVLGGELGFLLGTWRAGRALTSDPARQQRIENAYRKFKADYLRQEAARLEAGGDTALFP